MEEPLIYDALCLASEELINVGKMLITHTERSFVKRPNWCYGWASELKCLGKHHGRISVEEYAELLGEKLPSPSLEISFWIRSQKCLSDAELDVPAQCVHEFLKVNPRLDCRTNIDSSKEFVTYYLFFR